jgi:hypothetical protein
LVANIGALKTHLPIAAHPIEILVGSFSRQIVEQGDGPAALMKMARGVHTNEAGAPRDQN